MSEVCEGIAADPPNVTQIFLRRTEGFRKARPAIDKRQSDCPRQAGAVPEKLNFSPGSSLEGAL
ncbi:hypothetical protein GCM10009827_034910 [Dactylosporangium maewongense]|uniref:Uncharacterized protein n=1 Tax=Dactylosporangium maewongense TaxID=634393 RepID=A0ABN2AF34_9ACTN